jgi:hypothetical protein
MIQKPKKINVEVHIDLTPRVTEQENEAAICPIKVNTRETTPLYQGEDSQLSSSTC